MKPIIYIPCATNPHILYEAIESLDEQVGTFRIINSTGKPLKVPTTKAVIYDSPVPLLFGQALNFAIQEVERRKDPFCLWAHNDIVVKPGAIDALFKKYEEVKDRKWGQILSNYDSLCLFNPRFFVDHNMWEEFMMFPFYFSDKHRARLMNLIGYEIHDCPEASELVYHKESNSIRYDPAFRIRNEYMFEQHGAIYRKIWGGDPGQEKNTDATVRGLYKV